MGEYFFGVTLDSTNKEYKWDPDTLEEESNGDITFTPKGEHVLTLKHLVLTGTVEGEKNLLEVETPGFKKVVKIPFASMVVGKNNHVTVDINFPEPPATIRLVEGSGPVHVTGVHMIHTDQFENEEDDDDEDEELDEIEEEEEEEVDVEEKVKAKETGKGKKRTNSNSGPQPSKKKQKNGKEAAA